MSETFRCDDKETLVAYLYGEIDAADGREVERHLRTCVACADEVQALQAVRHDLKAWVPPEADLGFTIVPNTAAELNAPATVLRPARWAAIHTLPAWAKVAAAVLLVAASAAIANLQVRYGNGGFTVTTGWMSHPVADLASTPSQSRTAPTLQLSSPSASTADDWRPALVALEERLRNEMRVGSRDTVPVASDEMLRSVRALLRDSEQRYQEALETSEQRQRQELAVRLTQFNRDIEMKRQADLINVNRTVGTLQNRTWATQANQREMMNMLRLVSTQAK